MSKTKDGAWSWNILWLSAYCCGINCMNVSYFMADYGGFFGSAQGPYTPKISRYQEDPWWIDFFVKFLIPHGGEHEEY